MKNFKNVFKKVTVVMLVVAFIASVGCNVYQYYRTNKIIEIFDDYCTVIDDSWQEVSDKISVTDRVLFENVLERNVKPVDEKYNAKTVITIE